MESVLETAMDKADPNILKQILQGTNKKRSGDHHHQENDEESKNGLPRKRHKMSDNTNGKEPPKTRKNRYSGWTVPHNDYVLETINASDVTPEQFYDKYIRQRRPVVIAGSLETIANAKNLEKWKSMDYLKNVAGDETVVVEKRSDEKDSFGKGNEVSMKFHSFLDLISKGDSMHYLTTQDVEANQDGRPDLMAPFMKTFKGDFPLRPPLMGNLIPQNINLWMGNNTDGASSGLHHDYHDNLYIVLKGRKRFRLYSPMDTEYMYTRGKLLQVHENGRINYEGDETTAYGADIKSDAAARAAQAKEVAEEMLANAEQDVADGVEGAQERLEQAEEAMDSALEALLDAEVDDSEGEEKEDVGGLLFGGNGTNMTENDEDDENDEGSDEGVVVDQQESSGDVGARRLVDKTVKNPNSFSRVDFSLLDNSEDLKKLYPDMLKAKVAFCDIKEGQCLYLPASWFHEVRSYGGREGGHLAMNYWFHPPDATNDYAQPYTTNFWPNDYQERFED